MIAEFGNYGDIDPINDNVLKNETLYTVESKFGTKCYILYFIHIRRISK